MKDTPLVQLGWGKKGSRLDQTKVKLLQNFILGKRVIDIGCATGIYSKRMKKLRLDVTSTDINFALLSKAESLNRVVSSITHLPFKNKQFDTTILFDILEHVHDKCLKEVIRITKRRIILTVPRTTDKNLKNNWLVYGHHQDTTHKRTYTRRSLKKLLLDHSLKPVLIKPSHPISTDALFLDILEGKVIIKKLIRRFTFLALKPKQFNSNLTAVVDL